MWLIDSTFTGGNFFRDFINNYLSAYSESFLFWRITRKGTITPEAHKPEPSNFHALVSRRFDGLVYFFGANFDSLFRDVSPSLRKNREKRLFSRFFFWGRGTSVHRLDFEYLLNSKNQSAKPTDLKIIFFCLIITFSFPFWYLILRMLSYTWWKFYFRVKKSPQMCLKINWPV